MALDKGLLSIRAVRQYLTALIEREAWGDLREIFSRLGLLRVKRSAFIVQRSGFGVLFNLCHLRNLWIDLLMLQKEPHPQITQIAQIKRRSRRAALLILKIWTIDERLPTMEYEL